MDGSLMPPLDGLAPYFSSWPRVGGVEFDMVKRYLILQRVRMLWKPQCLRLIQLIPLVLKNAVETTMFCSKLYGTFSLACTPLCANLRLVSGVLVSSSFAIVLITLIVGDFVFGVNANDVFSN